MFLFNGAKRILQIMELNHQTGRKAWSTGFGFSPFFQAGFGTLRWVFPLPCPGSRRSDEAIKGSPVFLLGIGAPERAALALGLIPGSFTQAGAKSMPTHLSISCSRAICISRAR